MSQFGRRSLIVVIMLALGTPGFIETTRGQENPDQAIPSPSVGTRDVVAELERQFGPPGVGRWGPPKFAKSNFDTGHLGWSLLGILGAAIALAGLLVFHATGLGVRGEEASRAALVLLALLSVGWVLWVYSLAFAHNPGSEKIPSTAVREDSGMPYVGSDEYVAMHGISSQLAGSSHEFPLRRFKDVVPHLAFMTFHMFVFLLALVPLAVGLNGRLSFGWQLVAMAVWGTCVYAPVAHWIWGFGWLRQRGAMDFAGGAVVHLTGGIAALSAMPWLRGPTSAAANHGDPRQFENRVCWSVAVAWIGSMAMHAGFGQMASPSGLAALLNVHLGLCCGGIGWSGLKWLKKSKVTAADFATGAMAGLAAISAGGGYVPPQSALIIGLVGGLLGQAGDSVLRYRASPSLWTRIFTIHGIGGAAGILLLAVFLTPSVSMAPNGQPVMGMLGGNFEPIRVQSLTLVAVAGWTFLVSSLVFFAVGWLNRTRFAPEGPLAASERRDM